MKEKDGNEVEINEIRSKIRNILNKKYGGVTRFLTTTEKGKEIGGVKVKIYLYDTGPVNFRIISALCEFLGIGKLTRKLVVVRRCTYKLATIPKHEQETV